MAQEPLLEFKKGRHTAYLDLVDGKWEYGGDVPIQDSAKVFFECLIEQFDECMVKNFVEIEKRYNKIKLTVINGDIKIKE